MPLPYINVQEQCVGVPYRGIGVAWDCPVTHTHMPHPLGKFSYQCSRQGCSEVQYPPNQSMGRYTDMADCQQACDLGHFSYKCVSPLQGCAEVQQPPNKAAGRYTTRDQCRQVCHPAQPPVHVQGSCMGPSGCAQANTYNQCMANNAAGCKWIGPTPVHVQGCMGPGKCTLARTYNQCMADNAAGCKWFGQKDSYFMPSDTGSLTNHP